MGVTGLFLVATEVDDPNPWSNGADFSAEDTFDEEEGEEHISIKLFLPTLIYDRFMMEIVFSNLIKRTTTTKFR